MAGTAGRNAPSARGRARARPGPQGERGPRREREAGQENRRDGKPFEGKRRDDQRGERGERGPKGKPKGKPRHDGPKTFEARPPRAEKKADPDSPFAILAALKNKT
ncbi:hypothetical protein DIE28_06690 [Paracoccus thiocyanatus]|uniref:Uncharacterized protein n=1 Tax=Paracoccus thiocyanatus TaxID=34006 RepID=A0A3D8PC74_9RHOB|nr:hypothetical protein DIE28_06690 [Paracoccus thiocyanatus]